MNIQFDAKEVTEISVSTIRKISISVEIEEVDFERLIEENADKLKTFLVQLVAEKFEDDILSELGIEIE